MSPLAGEIARAALVGAGFLVVFVLAEAWKRYGEPQPEWTRKLVHIGGGLVSLSLPWMVRSHWTVLALGAVFALIIVGTRRLGLLGSVHGVERRSEGGLYFPVAVYLLYLFAADRPVLYVVPLLALVVADALAALVGSSYGRLAFHSEGDRKTIEGSAVFLLTTFLAAHLPLLLMTGIGRAESVLIAAQLALLVTIFEAISLRGNDNLIVPLATYLLLVKMMPKPAAFLALQLAAQLVILAALLLLVWRVRVLAFSGTIAASVFFYGAFSLGGPRWVVAPAAALLAFYLVLRRTHRGEGGEPSPRYQLLAAFYTGIVPAALYVVSNVLRTMVAEPVPAGRDPFYLLYVGAIAAHLAILTRVFLEGTPWLERLPPAHWTAAWLVGVLAAVPAGLAVAPVPVTPAGAAVAVALPTLALAAYEAVARWRAWPRRSPWDVRAQALTVAAAALALLPLRALP